MEMTNRHVAIEGTYNLRDLGGYETIDGTLTRWRTFFRSDCLDSLTPNSKQELVDMGVRTIIDLRTPNELESKPSVFDGSAAPRYVHIDMLIEGTPPFAPETASSTERKTTEYIGWIDERQGQVLKVLNTLATPEALPALYNCHSGKDRTGVISALLLGLAGVPPDAIAEDYALTATYLWTRDRTEFEERKGRKVTFAEFLEEYSPSEVMTVVLKHIENRYGGVTRYVEQIGLGGLETELLRSNLRS